MKNSKRMLNMVITCFLLLICLSIQAFAEDNTVKGIGFVTANALHLRQQPSTTSKSLAYASQNECVVVLTEDGDWYKVIYNLQEGYMHKKYLTVNAVENAELGYGKVTGSAVNLRSGPATTYSKVTTAAKDAKCYIIGLNQGWYKVIYGSNVCYIRSDYLELTEIPYENKASSNSPKFFRTGKTTGVAPSAAALNGTTVTNPKNVTGQQIVSKAKQYLGTPYVSGGASPAGFDCSGFVYYVFKQLGFSMERTPAAQMNIGRTVAKKDLQAGDIVYFAGTVGSGISHVGIYVGNGQFIHAPNSRSVVSYSDLTTGYWSEHYYTAHRVVS